MLRIEMLPARNGDALWIEYGDAESPRRIIVDGGTEGSFGGGLRAVDFSNPYMPKEVGYYVPNPGKGYDVVMSNDVFHDKDGKLYLIDRYEGLEILEPEI